MTQAARPRQTNSRPSVGRPGPAVSARLAGLRYSADDRPGITRRRAGRGFAYRDPDGHLIGDNATRARIRALAIPPAWTDVWISTDPQGHLQATGRDAAGRKQYRYHPRWRTRRDDAKFERILAFAALLPRIRRRVDRDLARRSLDRAKVLAAVVRLLELTLIRVGNDEYARLNRSFGLTTLKDRHVAITGSTIRFRFRGKSGRQHDVDIRDRRLAGIVRRCRELPGQELFQWVDAEGRPQDVTSDDVNDYLRTAAGADVTTRDFRIWAGTVMAYRALSAIEDEAAATGEPRRDKHALAEAVRIAAEALGNTAAVARRSYVHPAVLEAYLDGGIQPRGRRRAPAPAQLSPAVADRTAEAALLELLHGPLERQAGRSRSRAARTAH